MTTIGQIWLYLSEYYYTNKFIYSFINLFCWQLFNFGLFCLSIYTMEDIENVFSMKSLFLKATKSFSFSTSATFLIKSIIESLLNSKQFYVTSCQFNRQKIYLMMKRWFNIEIEQNIKESEFSYNYLFHAHIYI